MSRLPSILLLLPVLAARAETPSVTAGEQRFLARVNGVAATNAVAAARLFDGLDRAASSAALDFTLGGLLFQAGRPAEAADAFAAALAKAPRFHAARSNLGRARLAEGGWDAAADAFAGLVRDQAADAETYRLLGQCRLAQEQPVSAETAFRHALLLDPGDASARLGLAQSLMRQNRPADALALAREGLRAQPADPALWRIRAWAEQAGGDAGAAVVSLETMRRLNLLGEADRPRLAALHLAAGRAADALAVIEEESARGGFPAALLVQTAESFWRAGATAECARVLGWAEERLAGPGEASAPARLALRRLGAEIALAEDRPGDALAALEAVLREDPLDGAALVALGAVLARLERAEEARLALERAARRPGLEARALLAHARLEAGLGRFSRAAELARAALRHDERPEIRRYAEQLARAAQP